MSMYFRNWHPIINMTGNKLRWVHKGHSKRNKNSFTADLQSHSSHLGQRKAVKHVLYTVNFTVHTKAMTQLTSLT